MAAPKFLVSGVALVSAVCDAGMVGSLPSFNARSTDKSRDWLAQLNARAGAPGRAAYAVNLVTHRTNPGFAAYLEACAEGRSRRGRTRGAGRRLAGHA